MIIKERVSILENYLNELCKNGVVPGASFALLDMDDEYVNFLGKNQLEPTEEILKEDAIYDLASLTKIIATTTSIMILMERGYFTLDTFVSELLPDYRNRDVTIKHLLIHMSGHDADIDCKSMNKQQLIDSVYNNIVDPNKFDKVVVYSDIGYILLGFIVERLTGSLDEFTRENIFKPLKMNETFFNPEEKYINRCVPTEFCSMRNQLMKGIVHDEKSYVLGGVAGHAGLFSTVRDLSNFVRMYLNDGLFQGKIILGKQTIDLISKCYTLGTDTDRGLGWLVKGEKTVLCDFTGVRTLYHSGFTGTSILIDLDNKKGFVLLTNRVHPTRENNKIINVRRNIHNIAFSAIVHG